MTTSRRVPFGLAAAGLLTIGAMSVAAPSDPGGERALPAGASCRGTAPGVTPVFANRTLLTWVQHTLADTSRFARDNRNYARLPRSTTSSASVVTADSLCAALAYRFARAVDGRDTVNIAPVEAISIDASFFVVTDYAPRAPPLFTRVSDSVEEVDTSPKWTDAVTFDGNMNVVKVWKYTYLTPRRTPY